MAGEPQLVLPLDMTERGEIRTYRITLPFTPPSKNVYDKWMWQMQRACKKKWVKAIVAECEAQMIPKRVNPPIGLAALIVFPTRARRDVQNYANQTWHFVPDALQKAGVITGDHAGMIEFGPNLGVTLAHDARSGPKASRSRTIISLSIRVPE